MSDLDIGTLLLLGLVIFGLACIAMTGALAP